MQKTKMAVAADSINETPATASILAENEKTAMSVTQPTATELSAAEIEAQRAIALCMSLNRCMAPAYHRVQAYNFDIQGLVGFDMHLRTVGVVGDGAAAAVCAKLFGAFGAQVTAATSVDDLPSVST